MVFMENIIEVDLDSREEYINEYDDNRISDDLHEYILKKHIDYKKDVIIRVQFHFEVSKGEKELVKKMLYSDFKETLEVFNKEIKASNWKDIFLLGVGFLLFFLYYYFEKFHLFFFSEFILVVMWVAFWEIAEDILFYRRKLILKKKKYQKLFGARIDI